eukprot:397301-Karenia_brevis.AAC.1
MLGHLGATLGHLGAMLGHLERMLGHAGVMLQPKWCLLACTHTVSVHPSRKLEMFPRRICEDVHKKDFRRCS